MAADLVTLAAVTVACAFLLYQARARNEGKKLEVPRRRALALAFLLALIASAPAWVAFLARVLNVPVDVTTTAIVCFFTTLMLGGLLRSPGLPGTPDQLLPQLEDPAILARVAELAAVQGLQPPRVYRAPTVGRGLVVQGLAGGWLCPFVVLTDGTLERLNSAERDVVIAHELGHVAGHHVVQRALTLTALTSVGALVSGFVHMSAAITLVLALMAGVLPLAYRHAEYAADRAAANALGAEVTVRAFGQLYALARSVGTAWLWSLVDAIGSHPSLEARRHRLEALNARVPRARSTTLSRQRRLSALFLLAWALGVAGGFWLALDGQPAGAFLLATIGLMPLALLRALNTSELRRQALRRHGWDNVVLLIGLTVVALGTWIDLQRADNLAGYGILVGLALCVLALIVRGEKSRIRKDVMSALHRRDFKAVITSGVRSTRDPLVVGWVAFAQLKSGSLDAARQTLDGFLARRSTVPSLWRLRSNVESLAGHEEAALAQLDRAPRRLDGDANLRRARATTLLGLGRLDEAASAIDSALRADPDDARALALEARLFAQQGRWELATARLERADEFAPGDAPILLARAQVAILAGAGDAAEQVARVRRAVEADPFTLLETALTELESRLSNSSPP